MDACRAVVAANGQADAYIRPIAWRGAEQLSVGAQSSKIHLAIASWTWPNLFAGDRMKGVRLDIADWKRPPPDTAPTAAKASGVYMIGTLAKHKAEEKGFDDALLMDWKGNVAEGTGENVFFVFDGELHTPTPFCFLNGITRRTIISLARRQQIKVVERTIAAKEMAAAAEVFVTGTAAELTPVRAIGDLAFTPGRITETLLNDYTQLIRLPPAEVDRRAPI
jgi:branched-chain amino acid aminotransferase